MGQILPISKSENKRLDFLLKELKDKHRQDLEDRMMNSGFASASVLNFDNNVIVVDMNFGIQIEIPELVFSKSILIDRKTMQVIEKSEV